MLWELDPGFRDDSSRSHETSLHRRGSTWHWSLGTQGLVHGVPHLHLLDPARVNENLTNTTLFLVKHVPHSKKNVYHWIIALLLLGWVVCELKPLAINLCLFQWLVSKSTHRNCGLVCINQQMPYQIESSHSRAYFWLPSCCRGPHDPKYKAPLNPLMKWKKNNLPPKPIHQEGAGHSPSLWQIVSLPCNEHPLWALWQDTQPQIQRHDQMPLDMQLTC